MPLINISINGRTYELACSEGQESRLRAHAKEVGDRAIQLSKENPNADEAQILAMVSVMMADELHFAHKEDQETKHRLNAARDALANAAANSSAGENKAAAYIADVFDQLSDRLERIAKRIEQSIESDK